MIVRAILAFKWLIIGFVMINGPFFRVGLCQDKNDVPSKSIELYIEYFPRYVLCGESLSFVLRVKNNGDKPIDIWPHESAVPGDVIKVSVQDSEGQSVALNRGLYCTRRPRKKRPVLGLRPGLSYKYPEPPVGLEPIELGLHRLPRGSYALTVYLDVAHPPVTVSAETQVDFVPFNEGQILWQSEPYERHVKARGDYAAYVERRTVIKYELPDGAWLIFIRKGEEGKTTLLSRLWPVDKKDQVRVLFNDEPEPYYIQQINDFRVWKTHNPWHPRTTHILTGQPGKRGCYMCMDLLHAFDVYERRFVEDFARARLERQPDGRVVLVEEK